MSASGINGVSVQGQLERSDVPGVVGLDQPRRIYTWTSFSQPVIHPVCRKSIWGISKQNYELASIDDICWWFTAHVPALSCAAGSNSSITIILVGKKTYK